VLRPVIGIHFFHCVPIIWGSLIFLGSIQNYRVGTGGGGLGLFQIFRFSGAVALRFVQGTCSLIYIVFLLCDSLILS